MCEKSLLHCKLWSILKSVTMFSKVVKILFLSWIGNKQPDACILLRPLSLTHLATYFNVSFLEGPFKYKQKVRILENSSVSETSYLNEDEHTGNEDEGHVECQELQQRQRETAFITALLHSWRCTAKKMNHQHFVQFIVRTYGNKWRMEAVWLWNSQNY